MTKDTYSLPADKWHELEKHLLAANAIVKQAERFDNSKLAIGVGLPALKYRVGVYVIKPKEAEK